MAQQKQIWVVSMRIQVWPWPHSVGWGSSIAIGCGVGCRCSSDLAVCRPVAIGPIWPLAWELLQVLPLKKKKKKKKNQHCCCCGVGSIPGSGTSTSIAKQKTNKNNKKTQPSGFCGSKHCSLKSFFFFFFFFFFFWVSHSLWVQCCGFHAVQWGRVHLLSADAGVKLKCFPFLFSSSNLLIPSFLHVFSHALCPLGPLTAVLCPLYTCPSFSEDASWRIVFSFFIFIVHLF